MDGEEKKQNNNLVPGIAVATLVAGLATAGIIMAKKPSDNPTMMALYKDGQFESVGNYISPAGPEEIGVKLTLKNGVVTDASATAMATHEKSVYYQTMFVDNFKEQVVGKKIDEISLDRVSGSSLTPKGFNEAVAKIKSQAKS